MSGKKLGDQTMQKNDAFDDKAPSYSAGELRGNLAAVLRRAQMRNEEIPISNHGQEVAGVVSMYDVQLLKFLKQRFGREEIEAFERELLKSGVDSESVEAAFDNLIQPECRRVATRSDSESEHESA